MSYLVLLLVCCIALVTAAGDRVIYDLSTTARCIEETRGPSRDCRWPAGLNMVDQKVKGGRIIAYKIRWFSGRWSGWFVPGINDLDEKFNPRSRPCSIPYKANTMRRRWSNFFDHTHTYIICRP